MILKALYDYYGRHRDFLPQYGLEEKQIGFIIVINPAGEFVRLEDRRIGSDKKRANTFLVRKGVVRTLAPKANYLYDNSTYVFGYSADKSQEKCREYFDCFKDAVKTLYENAPDNKDVAALWRFYQNDPADILSWIKSDPLWEEVEKNLDKKYSVFSFLMEGDAQVMAAKKDLLALCRIQDEGKENLCLITGHRAQSVRISSPTPISGGKTNGKLVAFNTGKGYDSYGKEQGLNAPVSMEAEFAYSTALNHLLSIDSKNRFILGSRTYVFWASNDNEACLRTEESMYGLFGIKKTKENDADRQYEQVRKVFRSIYSGVLTTSLEDRFYILGLTPSSARIAVVYWVDIPLNEFAEKILRHFVDMKICGAAVSSYGIYDMLGAVTFGGKYSDATPNLSDALMKSIFEGIPYPYTLYAQCIRRIRAEQTVTPVRAAIIKACLNRMNVIDKKIDIMIDKENTNKGYLCGRLFAVLDKIQEEGMGLHSIRDRFLNAASSTPSGVFATILNLSSHHSEKLNEGRKVWFEKLKQEIIEKLPAEGFPSHLDLQDQGRFFVGFYHQRQDLFASKSETEK